MRERAVRNCTEGYRFCLAQRTVPCVEDPISNGVERAEHRHRSRGDRAAEEELRWRKRCEYVRSLTHMILLCTALSCSQAWADLHALLQTKEPGQKRHGSLMTELTRHLIRQADCRLRTYDPRATALCPPVTDYSVVIRLDSIRQSAPFVPPRFRVLAKSASSHPRDTSPSPCPSTLPHSHEPAAPPQQPQAAERHCFRSTRSMSCCCELISSLR